MLWGMEENPYRKPLMTRSGCAAAALIVFVVGFALLYLIER